MKSATISLTGNNLMDTLTINALDLLYSAGNPEDPEISKLESAIALIAEAWELPQEALINSQTLIAAEREATRCELRGEKAQANPQKSIPEHHEDCTVISILWGLFETVIHLDTEEKRNEILQCARFLADVMELQEWIADPRSPNA